MDTNPKNPQLTNQHEAKVLKEMELNAHFDAAEAAQRRTSRDAIARKFKLGLTGVAGVTSASSGLCWWLSASAGVDVMLATAKPNVVHAAVEKLMALSAYQNQWAAFLAAVAGILFAVVLLWDHWSEQ